MLSIRTLAATAAGVVAVGSFIPSQSLAARVPELPYCLPVSATVMCSVFVNTADCFTEGGVTYCQTTYFYWWTKGNPV